MRRWEELRHSRQLGTVDLPWPKEMWHNRGTQLGAVQDAKKRRARSYAPGHGATAEDLMRTRDWVPAREQPNHDGLRDFLLPHFRPDIFVAFYGSEPGDFAALGQ